MRYYLDTNTLIYILLDKRNEIDRYVAEILEDFSNSFFVSSIVVRELVMLFKNKKIKHQTYKSVSDIFRAIDIATCEIKPFTKQHVIAYAKLELAENHKDPSDHMIMAQSIADRIPIISSDTAFKYYEKQGLTLVFNKRG